MVRVSVLPGGDLGAGGSSEEGVPIMVQLEPPTGSHRTPSDICCVVDVSGSMGVEALLKTNEGSAEGHGLSVLDVVKHALTTIIRNMEEYDRLALVAYSNDARTIFELTEMDQAGREQCQQRLSDLHPAGMTNLWDGLKMGFSLLEKGANEGRLQHVMLFTDGLPNINPPRGILPMLKRMKDGRGGRLPCTINTFGFGFELDSDLLSQMAIEGAGAYAFIPDAGFVGTVFVNAVSNLLVNMAKDVTLTLTPENGASFAGKVLGGFQEIKKVAAANDDTSIAISLAGMQYGQTKSVVVPMNVPAEAVSGGYLRARVSYGACGDSTGGGTLGHQGFGKGAGDEATAAAVEPERLRLRFVDTVRLAMQKAKLTTAEKSQGKPLPLPAAQECIQALVTEISASPAKDQEAMQALLEDLKGQVMEALSREDWYTKWGIHYLPSLMFAHLVQQCNNFKDAGVQHYGGDLFTELRDKADDIFVSLPPPTPTLVRGVTTPASGMPPPTPPVAHAAPLNMAAFHDRYAGCFDGECSVRLVDGSARKVSEVRKGDVLAPDASRGAASGAEVVCVVRTLAPQGRFPLVELPGGLRITSHHPVWADGAWRFPIDLADASERECHAVYTFLLAEGASAASVNGVPCVALGHGIMEGAARHPFFGSWHAVEAELRRLPGFNAGLVDLDSVVRDPATGLVCGFGGRQ